MNIYTNFHRIRGSFALPTLIIKSLQYSYDKYNYFMAIIDCNLYSDDLYWRYHDIIH